VLAALRLPASQAFPIVPIASDFAARLASYLLATLALLMILQLHLLSALLAGLLVYQVVDALSPLLQRWLSGERARLIAVAVISALVVTLLVLLIVGVISFYRHEIGDPDKLWQEQLLPLLDKARQQLPPILTDHLPDSVESLRLLVTDWARSHRGGLQLAGKNTARVLLHVFIGLVLGGIVALSHSRQRRQARPLTAELSLRCRRLFEAFHNIIYAQIKISLINTALAALFLLVALPLGGVTLPLGKTLVLVTFVVGLLPVVGNLISNTLITVVALSVSMWVGVAALSFLVLVHKLEYFLNARIVGTQIRARTWELLIAMLVMEAAFGLSGLIAAPIYYAYLKSELEAARLI
jgi:predicted PurR-regulated permease PerM